MTERHENKLIRLVDLVVTKRPPILVDHEFVNCELVGPAVLQVIDGCAFVGLAIESPAVFWQLDVGREYIGGIGIQRCRFEACSFSGVGFAGNAEFIQAFADNLRGLS